jgi:hypothetical protein
MPPAAKTHQTKGQQRCGDAKNNSIPFRHVYLHCALQRATRALRRRVLQRTLALGKENECEVLHPASEYRCLANVPLFMARRDE